ncbi:MAG: hypothetical protein K2N71_06025, partial [Oscillospiraceae bacterium]|nr:hypothetical protein [Oscillospiraceae bacterium]
MKKLSLLCIALAALMLTSCHEYHEGDITGVPSETTSLTLTEEIIPEKTPDSNEPLREIELAVYSPFANAVKVDNTVKKELLEAVEKISDARGFLYASPTMFYYKSKYYTSYADMENPLEKNAAEEYTYCPLNTDIAKTEEELVSYLRSCFTEEFISDEEMQKTLFEEVSSAIPAGYKTIDGTLCFRQEYVGVAPEIHFDEFLSINSYDGDHAEVVFYAVGVSYPPYHAVIGLSRSEQYGWRADSIEFKDYDETFNRLYITGFMEKYDTLNKILGGGNIPENSLEITENGIKYVQTDLDMSVEEMREFFTDTFRSMTVTEDGSRSKLLVPYT